MNRDFEMRQLLRAYRSGIMSEAAFEEEMAKLEREAEGMGQSEGFEAFGHLYRSEREALLSFFDKPTPRRWMRPWRSPNGRPFAGCQGCGPA
jgi:hypothetical protein